MATSCASSPFPYAAPPVGALRWRPPAAPTPWTTARAATRFGPVCPQPLQPPPSDLADQSEDCLTLNVFAPAAPPPAAGYPVMVWIHGGYFAVGAGGQPFYDCARLARRGVVVVTLNYRLGRLGFFAHPGLTQEAAARGEPVANYGLMDQIAALRWVRANVRAFGGNAANVTVFGESAGGMAIDTLMASPAGRGLFDKAIVESGLGRNTATPLPEAEAAGVRFAASLNAESLTALRALPARAIVDGWTPKDPDGAHLVRDGRLIVEDTAPAFAAGRSAPVPLLIGSNDNEASLDPRRPQRPAERPRQAAVRRARLCARDLRHARRRGGQGGRGPPASPPRSGLIAPSPNPRASWRIARRRWASRSGATPTATFPPRCGVRRPAAAHAAEVQFVFGSLGVRGPDPTDEDRRMSDTLQAYWTDFARSGDPNGAGLPVWPKDSQAEAAAMVFSVDGAVAAPDFAKARLDLVATGESPPTR